MADDTVERIRDGMRRYITTFIDPVFCLAFAWASTTKHAHKSRHALELALSVLPKPKTLLSDNGTEFEGAFDQAIEEHGMQRG